MVAPLSVLTSLESLSLEFSSPESHPGWESRGPPPVKRSILPVLNEFCFQGIPEYLEYLVAFIDAPQLDYMEITFFGQINFDFDSPQLVQFINCTPALSPRNEAHVQFDYSSASIKLGYGTSEFVFDRLQITTSFPESDLMLLVSSISQVCNSSLPPPSTVEDLYIESRDPQLYRENSAIENALWLELLLPFSAVKNLYLSNNFAPDIAAVLQELIGARITEVLPSLQNIFVEGLEDSKPSKSLQENIWQFAGARRQSGHPVAISDWDEGPDTELMSQ